MIRIVVNPSKYEGVSQETLKNLSLALALVNRQDPSVMSCIRKKSCLAKLKILLKSMNPEISNSAGILISTFFLDQKIGSFAIKKFCNAMFQKCTTSLASSRLDNFLYGLIILENISKSPRIASIPECSVIVITLLDLMINLSKYFTINGAEVGDFPFVPESYKNDLQGFLKLIVSRCILQITQNSKEALQYLVENMNLSCYKKLVKREQNSIIMVQILPSL
mmetsp:Transcript_17019/g.16706  ORF Transcript_17019/g.16706 Transcript_17019/m.16706 type:complete len:222 (+) Transcript_17019:441-1106(+)